MFLVSVGASAQNDVAMSPDSIMPSSGQLLPTSGQLSASQVCGLIFADSSVLPSECIVSMIHNSVTTVTGTKWLCCNSHCFTETFALRVRVMVFPLYMCRFVASIYLVGFYKNLNSFL